MKLIITPDFPPMRGGIARWAFELYKELKPEEEVKVIIRKNSSILSDTPDFIYYTFTGELKKILDRFGKNIDIIFFHIDCAISIFLWCKLKKLKYTIVLHGKEFLRPRSFYTRFKISLLFKFACEIWVTSPYMKDKVLEYNINNEKIKLVGIPVDREKFRRYSKERIKRLKEKYNVSNRKIILSVARLVERKDFFTVFKAVELLIKKYPELLYIIIGGGPLRDKMLIYIKQNRLERYIKLLGEVSDRKLVDWYNISDVFVLTPKETEEDGDIEGFGIVYHEAHFCGLPVIGSETGGVKFSLSLIDNSYLIKPGDYKKLARIISKILFS